MLGVLVMEHAHMCRLCLQLVIMGMLSITQVGGFVGIIDFNLLII
jgi:hypothetical protein